MITKDFEAWLKDFIPKKHDPENCNITGIRISYREVLFQYETPKCKKSQWKALMLELIDIEFA